MLPALLLLFVLLPIAEIAVIVQVGQEIGALWTVAILVADSVLGAWLLRTQGRAAWRRFIVALGSGRPPAVEAIDGALVIFGAACLLTPGFITDLFGFALLAPPTRAVLRRLLLRRFGRRLMAEAVGRFAGPAGGGLFSRGGPSGGGGPFGGGSPSGGGLFGARERSRDARGGTAEQTPSAGGGTGAAPPFGGAGFNPTGRFTHRADAPATVRRAPDGPDGPAA